MLSSATEVGGWNHGKPGTFLETTFRWEGGRFRYWLKNDNEVDEVPRIWRYADFRSHDPFEQKRASLTMMLRKVHRMASDSEALRVSALQSYRSWRSSGL